MLTFLNKVKESKEYICSFDEMSVCVFFLIKKTEKLYPKVKYSFCLLCDYDNCSNWSSKSSNTAIAFSIGVELVISTPAPLSKSIEYSLLPFERKSK